MRKFIIISIFIFILCFSLVYAAKFTQDYNDAITRSVGDFVYCKIDGSNCVNISGAIDTNASTACSGIEVLLGNGSCTSTAPFGVGITDTNASTACSGIEVLLGNGSCINSTDLDTNVSVNFGANESDPSGIMIPFLLTSEGVLKIETEEVTGIWEQIGNEIKNANGNVLNISGELIVSQKSTFNNMINITGVADGSFTCYMYNPNGGCMLGGNSTCNILFSPDGLSSQEICN